MNVTFENLINVWDAQIPNLLVELVNHAVFATDKAGFQAVVTKSCSVGAPIYQKVLIIGFITRKIKSKVILNLLT